MLASRQPSHSVVLVRHRRHTVVHSFVTPKSRSLLQMAAEKIQAWAMHMVRVKGKRPPWSTRIAAASFSLDHLCRYGSAKAMSHTPQHNGMVERLSRTRTLVEAALAMTLHAGAQIKKCRANRTRTTRQCKSNGCLRVHRSFVYRQSSWLS
jgi:hypothetical protein